MLSQEILMILGILRRILVHSDIDTILPAAPPPAPMLGTALVIVNRKPQTNMHYVLYSLA